MLGIVVCLSVVEVCGKDLRGVRVGHVVFDMSYK